MLVADGTSLFEPELFYLPFMHRPRARGAEPTAHRLPIREIQGLSIGVGRLDALSAASRAAAAEGLVEYFAAAAPVMEIEFAGPSGPSGMSVDLRPTLPLIFRSAGAASVTPQVLK